MEGEEGREGLNEVLIYNNKSVKKSGLIYLNWGEGIKRRSGNTKGIYRKGRGRGKGEGEEEGEGEVNLRERGN